jgi:hypothetical protein
MLLVLAGFENLDSRLGSFHLRKGLAFTFQISGSVNLLVGLRFSFIDRYRGRTFVASL